MGLAYFGRTCGECSRWGTTLCVGQHPFGPFNRACEWFSPVAYTYSTGTGESPQWHPMWLDCKRCGSKLEGDCAWLPPKYCPYCGERLHLPIR